MYQIWIRILIQAKFNACSDYLIIWVKNIKSKLHERIPWSKRFLLHHHRQAAWYSQGWRVVHTGNFWCYSILSAQCRQVCCEVWNDCSPIHGRKYLWNLFPPGCCFSRFRLGQDCARDTSPSSIQKQLLSFDQIIKY